MARDAGLEEVCRRAALMLVFFLAAWGATAQELNPSDLKQLSLEELLEVRVTSVSRQPEKITEVASAVQILTNEEIHRSGATTLAEALRLIPNLNVAQLTSGQWIIGARGFNATFSNKLLVMIDGRTVYSPLFAGVFWDVQQLPLEDVERIEVISGPGGSMWGANAVNGVINIITRKSRETQGVYASAGVGTFHRRNAVARYGGNAGRRFSYRVYAMHSKRDHTFSAAGDANSDAWRHTQTGFRMDWNPSDNDAIVVLGDVYSGKHDHTPRPSTHDGQTITGRWSHQFSDRSSLTAQGSFARTWRRDRPSTFSDELFDYSFDVDHNVRLGRRHDLIWGLDCRIMDNRTLNSTPSVGFVPRDRRMEILGGFIQDEISYFDDQLRIALGAKLQYHDMSGLALQPTVRTAWVRSSFTLWGAVSRAVRAPSRIDVDYRLPVEPLPPDQPSVAGGPDFESEKLTAYELGLRIYPTTNLFFSVAGFYNRYDDLYSVDPLPNTLTFVIQNRTEGRTHGVEFAGHVAVVPQWRLRGGYTYLHKDLRNKPGSTFDYSLLGNDAKHRVSLHSMANLPGNFQFDVAFRYISRLPQPAVSDYATFDTRLAWSHRSLELAVVGQNLWEDQHQEFMANLPRSVYGQITWRL